MQIISYNPPPDDNKEGESSSNKNEFDANGSEKNEGDSNTDGDEKEASGSEGSERGSKESQTPQTQIQLNYEETTQWPLKEIPLMISLDDKVYTLASVILFEPPRNANGIGHYTAAVRQNNKFEVFDDLRTSTYTIDNKTEACIHSLLYVSSTYKSTSPKSPLKI